MNTVIQRFRAGEQLKVYSMGNFASPRHVDWLGRSGLFDVVWFDLEHFEISMSDLAVLTMVAHRHGMGALARISATDYQSVMRPLEAGVDALMCAMVANAEEARQIVSWARFPNPLPAPGEVTGTRGWNGGNVDAAYGNTPAAEYLRAQNTQTLLLCQIENDPALAQVEAIAATPGVDALFFGPGDYAASRGEAGQITSPSVVNAWEQVSRAARNAGKAWGTVAVGSAMWDTATTLGAGLLCPGGDVKVMNLGLRELARTFTPDPAPFQTTTTY